MNHKIFRFCNENFQAKLYIKYAKIIKIWELILHAQRDFPSENKLFYIQSIIITYNKFN